MTPESSIEVLRVKWIEMEYDAIITNGAADFIWESLKQSARSMTHEDFVERLDEMEAFDDPHA